MTRLHVKGSLLVGDGVTRVFVEGSVQQSDPCARYRITLGRDGVTLLRVKGSLRQSDHRARKRVTHLVGE